MCLALAGDLATFSPPRRPPSFAAYRHDALRETFAPLMVELRRSLSQVLEQAAIPIELQERRFGVRVAVISDRELLRNAGFVLAVNAQMPAETLRTRFPAQVKIGPAERIRELVNLQLPGVTLHALPSRPARSPITRATATSSSSAAASCGRSSSARAAWRCTSPATSPGSSSSSGAIRG